jgi:hypothetical protein
MENICIVIVGTIIGCVLWEAVTRSVENNTLNEYNAWKRKQKEIRTTK